jgi:putative ABC transport system permease protein
MRELLQCAWQELKRSKIRTCTTLLGYALAVFVGVLLTHALIWTQQAGDTILNHTGTHFIAFVPTERSLCPPCAAQWLKEHSAEGFTALGVSTRLIPADFIPEVMALETVAEAAGYLQYRLRDPKDDHLLTIGGMDTNKRIVLGTTCCAVGDIVEGEFLPADCNNAVMLEQAYAKIRGLHAGSQFELLGESLSVVGVVNPGIRPAKADIYMHHRDASRLVRKRMQQSGPDTLYNMILVEVSTSDVQEEAIGAVKQLWVDLVISSYACYKPAAQASAIHNTALGSLIVVIGLGAVLFAMKSQMATVFERRRELGILKAIGFTNIECAQLIFSESLFQAMLGGLLGCGTVLFALLVIPATQWGLLPTQIWIMPRLFLIALVLCLLGGAVAGSIPAHLVVRSCPSKLLRCPD